MLSNVDDACGRLSPGGAAVCRPRLGGLEKLYTPPCRFPTRSGPASAVTDGCVTGAEGSLRLCAKFETSFEAKVGICGTSGVDGVMGLSPCVAALLAAR